MNILTKLKVNSCSTPIKGRTLKLAIVSLLAFNLCYSTVTVAKGKHPVHIGEQGVQGKIGPQGDTGVQGVQGKVGPAGEDGAQGIQGKVGDSGAKGDKGDQGPQGDQGDQGKVGPEGPSASSARATFSDAISVPPGSGSLQVVCPTAFPNIISGGYSLHIIGGTLHISDVLVTKNQIALPLGGQGWITDILVQPGPDITLTVSILCDE